MLEIKTIRRLHCIMLASESIAIIIYIYIIFLQATVHTKQKKIIWKVIPSVVTCVVY